MNLKDKLHDRVYLPTTNTTGQALCFHHMGNWNHSSNLHQSTTHYVLSPTELLELKKLWSGEAWEAGAWAEQDGHNAIHGTKPKKDFIDNLKLD